MIFDKVKEAVVETLSCNPDEVTMDTNLRDDLSADSIDAIELMMAINEAFDITIPDEKIPELATVGDIVRYIESQK